MPSESVQLVCPDCKTPLEQLRCSGCQVAFSSADDIPNLLSNNPRFATASSIGEVYDDIYAHRSNVWEDQGRTPAFIQFFSGLAADLAKGRILEVGCGEGLLLSQINANTKVAVDLSANALQKARTRAGAQCAVALAERLPFPDDNFDAVYSVGVMEHFLDEDAACAEIRRVLKPGAAYIALIHVQLTRAQELRQKIREFLLPRFRPVALARWLVSKVHRPIHQPIQRRFSVESARQCLQRNGLNIERVISLQTMPSAPLIGPHVVLYVARRPA